MKRFTLEPKNRKSFYGKCYVEVDGTKATLYSYDIKIMTYDTETKEVTVTDDYNFSQTTRRHQTAFCEFYDIDKSSIPC